MRNFYDYLTATFPGVLPSRLRGRRWRRIFGDPTARNPEQPNQGQDAADSSLDQNIHQLKVLASSESASAENRDEHEPIDIAMAVVNITQEFRERMFEIFTAEHGDNIEQVESLINQYTDILENMGLDANRLLSASVEIPEIEAIMEQLLRIRVDGTFALDEIHASIARIEGRLIEEECIEQLLVQMNEVLTSSQLNQEQINQLNELFQHFEEQVLSKECFEEFRQIVNNDRLKLNELELNFQQMHQQIQDLRSDLVLANASIQELRNQLTVIGASAAAVPLLINQLEATIARIAHLENENLNIRQEIQDMRAQAENRMNVISQELMNFIHHSQNNFQELAQRLDQIQGDNGAQANMREELDALARLVLAHQEMNEARMVALQLQTNGLPILEGQLLAFMEQHDEALNQLIIQMELMQAENIDRDRLIEDLVVNQGEMMLEISNLSGRLNQVEPAIDAVQVVHENLIQMQLELHHLGQQIENLEINAISVEDLSALQNQVNHLRQRVNQFIDEQDEPHELTYKKDYDNNHTFYFRAQQNVLKVSIFKHPGQEHVLAANEVKNFLNYHVNRDRAKVIEAFSAREIANPAFLAEYGLFAHEENVAQFQMPVFNRQ
jgi:hypothetical protein